jgi:hypothetical protein
MRCTAETAHQADACQAWCSVCIAGQPLIDDTIEGLFCRCLILRVQNSKSYRLQFCRGNQRRSGDLKGSGGQGLPVLSAEV